MVAPRRGATAGVADEKNLAMTSSMLQPHPDSSLAQAALARSCFALAVAMLVGGCGGKTESSSLAANETGDAGSGGMGSDAGNVGGDAGSGGDTAEVHTCGAPPESPICRLDCTYRGASYMCGFACANMPGVLGDPCAPEGLECSASGSPCRTPCICLDGGWLCEPCR
jgi:hypothetical protein